MEANSSTINEIHVILHVTPKFTAQDAVTSPGRLMGPCSRQQLAPKKRTRRAHRATITEQGSTELGLPSMRNTKNWEPGGQVVGSLTGLTAWLTLLTTRLRARQAELGIAQPQLNNGLVMAQVKWRVLRSRNGSGLC